MRAATAFDPAAADRVWSEIARRFDSELAPHFALEERYLLPALERSGGAELAKRVRNEHAKLRQLVFDEQLDAKNRLESFGALLQDHVRFEERVLFTTIQETLDDEVLDALASARITMS